jgi:pilus assembly protein CpaE
MYRYLLVSDDLGWEDRLRRALSTKTAATLLRLSPGAPVEDLQPPPNLVVIDGAVGTDKALELADRLDHAWPDTVMLLVAEPDVETLVRAMRANIREVLPPAASGVDLQESLERALQTVRQRRARADDESRHGRIVIVVSPKGGSGKTTIATNLAVGLAQASPGDVVLVDADLQFGDVTSALGMVTDQSILDTTTPRALDDPIAVKGMLAEHRSGLYVLAGVPDLADAEQVTPAHVGLLLQQLAQDFGFVVADTAAGLDETTLAALEVATDLVAVASMDVPSIRQLRKELIALDQIGLTQATRHLVLNRADSRVGLSIKDIEATLGLPTTAAVPSSRLVPMSTNQGTTMMESQPGSPVTRALGQLLVPFVPDVAPKRRRLFGG